MIVTLAGHVDHGKTSLVQALTGINTDSLAEEKRRGLTIDLGFAYLETPLGPLGFVDVPGHHKFIHNMVAGVASRQFALLVIAADDGPMPQSREHLQILQLLGLQHGLIALTKTDRVSPERIITAIEEIKVLTANTFLESTQIIATSVESGTGIDTLRAALVAAATSPTEADPTTEFRLAVDRAFSVTGAGCVVTGTVHSGQVSIDDRLYLFPGGQETRVRGVRAQNQEVTTATVGDRCALNLAGISSEAVKRGAWLCSKADSGSPQFSLSLQVLEDFPREVRHWLPVHVYHASAHSTGHLALLEEGRLQPGTKRIVELVTDEALLVRRGDHLILRDHGLNRTLGGGAVVSPFSVSGRRRSRQRLQQLQADAAGSFEDAFVSHLALGEVDLAVFSSSWSLDKTAIEHLLAEHGCLSVNGYAIAKTNWQQHLQTLSSAIANRHQEDAALQGLKLSDLSGIVPEHFLDAALTSLVSDKTLTLQTGRYRPVSHQVHLSEVETQLLEKVTRHLDQPQPPSLGDLAKLLRQPIPALSKGLLPLLAKKNLVRISDSRYYLPQQIKTLAGLALQLGERGPFTARDYRDAAAIGRNVAIELLEYFDARGMTRRNGNDRIISGGLERLNL